MTCYNIKQLLEAYLDKELRPEDTQLVEEHLQSCQSCFEEYQELKRLKELLSQNSSFNPKEEYWQENKNIILARTVESQSNKTEIADLYESKSDKIIAFKHSLISVAASLIIFLISVFIGTSSNKQSVSERLSPSPVLTKVNIDQSTNPYDFGLYSQENKIYRINGMMLLSLPGAAGRITFIRGIEGTVK